MLNIQLGITNVGIKQTNNQVVKISILTVQNSKFVVEYSMFKNVEYSTWNNEYSNSKKYKP